MIDLHLHTSFSTDGTYSPEEMCAAAVKAGLKTIAITDHYDLYWPEPETAFKIDDFDAYFTEIERVKELYKGRLKVLLGIEFGMVPDKMDLLKQLASEHKFDYIIGSQHIAGKQDIGVTNMGLSEIELTDFCMNELLLCLQTEPPINTLGHLDYIRRYTAKSLGDDGIFKVTPKTDMVLKELIRQGIALEINTSCGRGKASTFTCPSLITAAHYRDLGGRLFAVGSDAHDPGRVGDRTAEQYEKLLSMGFELVPAAGTI